MRLIINDYLDSYEYLSDPMHITDDELTNKILEIINIEYPNVKKEDIEWFNYDTIMGLIFGVSTMTSVMFYKRREEVEEYLAEWLRRIIKGEKYAIKYKLYRRISFYFTKLF